MQCLQRGFILEPKFAHLGILRLFHGIGFVEEVFLPGK